MSGDHEEFLVRLRSDQYAVVDNFLSLDFANELLKSSQELIKSNAFSQHRFSFGGSLLEKPGVFEIDLSGDCSKKPSELGAWNELVSDFAPSFVKRLAKDNALALKSGTPAVKVQLNTGGGSFPWHYDNPGPPSERSLTCIVYLNPNWTPGDGGELVLWPFLSKQIVVPPLHGRAVLFRSDTVLHRVLPYSGVRRLCFTMWCPGSAVNHRSDVLLSKDVLQFRSYDEAQAFFSRSPLQRVISRAVYSEEYLESLLECVENESDHQKISLHLKRSLVQQHENNVNQILVKLRPLIEEFRERKRL